MARRPNNVSFANCLARHAVVRDPLVRLAIRHRQSPGQQPLGSERVMFMNNTGARIAFGLLVFFVGWNPENAFGGDPDAWVGYQVCCEENRPGTYEYEEFVFFLVDVDITTTEVDEMHWEGEAMLAMGDAIRSYLTDGVKSFDIEQIPIKTKSILISFLYP